MRTLLWSLPLPLAVAEPARAPVAAVVASQAAAAPRTDSATADADTHAWLTCRALAILGNDGRDFAARRLAAWLDELHSGSAWADAAGRNRAHFYHPLRQRGLFFSRGAARLCTAYFERAVQRWQGNDCARGAFWLGAALHLVQDLCVPQHAACRLLAGHHAFEAEAARERYRHRVDSGGIYGVAADAGGWLHAAAAFSLGYLPLVDMRSRVVERRLTLTVLLAQAQRLSAGFLDFFLDRCAGVQAR